MINSFEIGTLKFILENFKKLSEYRRLETEILEKKAYRCLVLYEFVLLLYTSDAQLEIATYSQTSK